METAVVLAAAATVSDLMVGFEPKPPGHISCARPKTGASNTTARTAHASFFIDGSLEVNLADQQKAPASGPTQASRSGQESPHFAELRRHSNNGLLVTLHFGTASRRNSIMRAEIKSKSSWAYWRRNGSGRASDW